MLSRPNSSTPVLDLLKDPTKWTKGTAFKDASGKSCEQKYATCCCVYGATTICYQQNGTVLRQLSKVTMAIEKLFPSRNEYSSMLFNDHPETTHEEMIAALTEAQI